MRVLDLPKSKIALHRDAMVKYGPGENAVARFPTDQITKIGLEKSREIGIPIILIGLFSSLAWGAHRYIEAPGWSWTAIVFCLGICAFAVLGIEGRKLVIETSSGTVRYAVADVYEEAEGFVVSANALLERGGFEAAKGDEKKLVAAES